MVTAALVTTPAHSPTVPHHPSSSMVIQTTSSFSSLSSGSFGRSRRLFASFFIHCSSIARSFIVVGAVFGQLDVRLEILRRISSNEEKMARRCGSPGDGARYRSHSGLCFVSPRCFLVLVVLCALLGRCLSETTSGQPACVSYSHLTCLFGAFSSLILFVCLFGGGEVLLGVVSTWWRR